MRISDWSSDVGSSDLAAFALDGEHAFFHLDVDFLRRHARQVGVEDEPGGFLLDVNARHPLAGHDRGLVRGKVGERIAFEQAIENLLDRILAHVLARPRSEEHTSELQSLMRISYAVFCLKKKTPI